MFSSFQREVELSPCSATSWLLQDRVDAWLKALPAVYCAGMQHATCLRHNYIAKRRLSMSQSIDVMNLDLEPEEARCPYCEVERFGRCMPGSLTSTQVLFQLLKRSRWQRTAMEEFYHGMQRR